MRIDSLIVIILSASLFAFNLEAQPKMDRGNVVLGARVNRALKKKHTDFKVLSTLSFTKQVNDLTNNSPSAIIGDFNGDKVADSCVYGYSKQAGKFFIYAVISSKEKKSYEVYTVLETPFEKNQKTTDFQAYLNLGRREGAKAGDQDTIQVEMLGPPNQATAYYFSKKEKRILPYKGSLD